MGPYGATTFDAAEGSPSSVMPPTVETARTRIEYVPLLFTWPLPIVPLPPLPPAARSPRQPFVPTAYW